MIFPKTIALLFVSSLLAHADVTVASPWIRATVPDQKATGAFMDLISAAPCKLVSATSPSAGTVEIHEMKMEGEVMKMRQVKAIDLPQGATVKLAPGGYHVMLFDLKQEFKAGEKIVLELTFEMPDGKRETQKIEAVVRALTTSDKPNIHP